MAGSFPNARKELEPFLHARLRPGETLDERVLVYQDGAAMPMDDTAMTGISRRSSLSMPEYVGFFIDSKGA
ncbi:hypothetical protein ACFV3I_00205 [Microbacterium sp. NPDC059771]|uniref:hypothetical protein n=1 Tax=Microbacterium sp. NPDC059771 TaxID=3346941 RepID=UPI00197DD38E|nr:hypothetical protein [Aneurinibacillus sp. BA2021]